MLDFPVQSRGCPRLTSIASHRVERQEADSASTLNGFRAFMAWRKTQPTLRWGDIQFIDAPEPVLVFTRSNDGVQILAAFNLARDPVQLSLPEFGNYRQIECAGVLSGELHGEHVRLPGHGVVFGVRQRG